jgi:SAM-dependent methyltransferase
MLSIFTPSNNTRYLLEAYESIKDQPFDEWLILLNGRARPIPIEDTRIKWCMAPKSTPPWVGALKRQAVERCRGDKLIELDHDDLLLPGAVQAVKEALSDEAGFCYSNCVRVNETDGVRSAPERWGQGWEDRYRPYRWGAQQFDEVLSYPPDAASVSRIWYAPDHLRAFTRAAYDAAGGYNADMRILDDLDLMHRLYLSTTFVHIDRPLYVYRIHGKNSWLEHNAEIQSNTWRLHDRDIDALARRWADLNHLRKLDLGGRFNAAAGYETVDRRDADVTCDLNDRWPFEDNSIGVIRAYDILEHLADKLHVIQEIYRVLAPGGWLFAQVPSTDGRGAFQDPTHVSYYNENSFLYYTDQNWAKYIDTPVRFQAVRLYTTPMDDRRVCWVQAQLVCLKDGYKPPGAILI